MSIVFGTPTTGKLVLLVEAGRDAERVLAADRDERFEPLAREVREHPVDAALELVGFVREVPRIVPPRGRSPEISRGPERLEEPLHEPTPPGADADHLVPALIERRVTARITAFSPGSPRRRSGFRPASGSLSVPKVGLEPTRTLRSTGF